MALFAAILVLALLWLALLYVGVPLGIIGCCVAAYLFKDNSEGADYLDPTEASRDRRNAVIIAGASAALIIASLTGNYFNKDAPLHAWLTGKAEFAINQQGDD